MDDCGTPDNRFLLINPRYVGGYQIGGAYGLRIMFERKPRWVHRKMMKWCLGWEWIDN